MCWIISLSCLKFSKFSTLSGKNSRLLTWPTRSCAIYSQLTTPTSSQSPHSPSLDLAALESSFYTCCSSAWNVLHRVLPIAGSFSACKHQLKWCSLRCTIPFTLAKWKEHPICWLCDGGGWVAKTCLTLAIPQTVAHQSPLSMEFSRQEYWSRLPVPFPGDLPTPGIKPGFIAGRFFTKWAIRKALVLSKFVFTELFAHSPMHYFFSVDCCVWTMFISHTFYVPHRKAWRIGENE